MARHDGGRRWSFYAVLGLSLTVSRCGTAGPVAAVVQAPVPVPVPVHDNRAAVGGYSPVAVDKPEVLEAARFAVRTIGERNGATVPWKLIKILAAKSQVVAGTNYAMTLEIGHGEAHEVHDVVVFSQPWTRTMQLTKDELVK